MVKVISANSPSSLEKAVNNFLSTAKDCKIIGYNVVMTGMQNYVVYHNPSFYSKYTCMISYKSLT